MNRTPVVSSNVASIGYEPIFSTLEVEFLDGRVYHYYNVPMNLHDALMNAESKGGFLHQFIIGQFRYQKYGPNGYEWEEDNESLDEDKVYPYDPPENKEYPMFFGEEAVKLTDQLIEKQLDIIKLYSDGLILTKQNIGGKKRYLKNIDQLNSELIQLKTEIIEFKNNYRNLAESIFWRTSDSIEKKIDKIAKKIDTLDKNIWN